MMWLCILISIVIGGFVYVTIHERHTVKEWLCKQKLNAKRKMRKCNEK